MIRSAVSVLAGYGTWTALWLGLNAGLRAVLPRSFGDDGVPRDAAPLVLALTAAVLLSVISGFTTAALARRRRCTHALFLGALLLATGLAVQIRHWTTLPLWYHLPFLALLLPATTLGGWLRTARASQHLDHPHHVAHPR